MRRTVAVLAAILVSAVALAQQRTSSAVADEIVGLVKAQWAAEMQKNTAEALKTLADDYTEFNGDYSTRIEGKAVATRLAEGNAGGSGSLIAAEMANPKVQVYGDIAILSYNFMGIVKDKDGKLEHTRAKSTRVYVKQGGQWRLVHANFGQDLPPR